MNLNGRGMPEEGYKFVAATEPVGGEPPPSDVLGTRHCCLSGGPCGGGPDSCNREWTLPFTGAVLLCPVCVSTVDARRWGWEQYACETCGTEFVVDLRPDVVAEHAMVG
jgi:hypothetical protein